MPRNATAVDSAESAPSSLKSSPSKRERVRKFLRRVSSIGPRIHKHDQSLSQVSVAVTEAQAPGPAVHAASSPEPHVIDLTVEAVPVKALRRASTASSAGSILKHKTVNKLAAAVIDDASSFHSSAPSESSASDAQSDNEKHLLESQPAGIPHVEPEQAAADASANEAVSEIPPVDEAPAVDPASIPLPVDDEEEFNPVPPVFLSEEAEEVPVPEVAEPLPEVKDTSAIVDVPTIITIDDAAAPYEADAPVEVYPKDPFDDAYAADTESVSSASPELAPTVVFDIVETIELNVSTDAPVVIEATFDPEPEPEEASTSESSGSATITEVVTTVEVIISETIETIAPSPAPTSVEAKALVELPTEDSTPKVPAAEQQPTEAAPEAPAPESDTPYVVVVPPSPTSAEPPVVAAEPAPSVFEDTPSAPSSPSPALPSTQRSLTPLVSWLHSSLAALKLFAPARRGSLRWRTPMCYGIAVMCYSLTWYLARRPPVNVELTRFHM